MKKNLILCTLLLISLAFKAQEVTTKAKSTNKTTEKSVTVAKKEAQTNTSSIKKNATKENTLIKKTALKSSPSPVITQSTVTSKSKDKSAGKYNGKKVYRGPKGGTYYINSNGNKTYIDRK